MKNSSFTDDNFIHEFDNAYFRRSIRVDAEVSDENDIVELIHDNIHEARKQHRTLKRALLVNVDEGDGMTWTLEFLNRKLRNRLEDGFKFFLLPDYSKNERTPAVASFFEDGNFIKKAVRYKLMPRYQTNNRNLIITVALVVLTTIAIILSQILKNQAPSNFNEILLLLYDPYFIVIFLLSVFLAVAIKKLSTPSKYTKSQAIEKFKEQINLTETVKSKSYEKFVAHLARKIDKSFPRIIFVDNYDRMDLLSKNVIEKYFNSLNVFAGSEYWIVGQSTISHAGKLMNNIDDVKIKKEIFHQCHIMTLTDYEKEELVRLANIDETYSNFKTIKEVCSGEVNKVKIEDASKLLNEYVQKNRKTLSSNKMTEIDLLYLLSINTKPYNIAFSSDQYIDVFKSGSENSNIRNTVLRQFFHNTPLTKDKLEPRFDKIFSELSFAVVFEENKKFKIYDITEKAFENVNESNLPDKSIGHLYWSLHHGDRLEEHAKEFIWTRILTYHLLEANYHHQTIEYFEENKRYKKILENSYRYTIKAIDLSIETCYLSQLTNLSTSAYYLLLKEPLRSNQTSVNKFIKKLWQIYSLTFESEILDLALKLIKDHPKVHMEEKNILDLIFSNVLPESNLSYEQNYFAITSDGYTENRSIINYFRTFTSWFSITLIGIPVFDTFSRIRFYKALKFSIDYLNTSYKALDRIIENKIDESIEIDFRTLNLSTWAKALTFVYHREYEKILDEYINFLDFINKISLEIYLHHLKASAAKNGSELPSYYYKGQVLDLLTTILAAAIIPLKKIDVNRYHKGVLEKLNEIFSNTKDILDHDIKQGMDYHNFKSKTTIKKINNLFEFCAIIWSQLGVESFHDLVNIKRLQFISLFEEKDSQLSSLKNSLRLPISKQSIIGVMANVALACSFNHYNSKSNYFHMAVEIVDKLNFGKIFKNELFLLLVTQFYKTNFVADHYFSYLLIDNDIMKDFLSRLQDTEFDFIVPHLYNCSERITDNSIKTLLFESLDERADKLRNEITKRKFNNWKKSLHVKNLINDEETFDYQEVLADWSEDKDSWLYPSILNDIIDYGYYDKSLEEEAIEVLKKFTYDPVANTYIPLAYNVSLHAKELNLKVALNCLSEHLNTWEDRIQDYDKLILYYERLQESGHMSNLDSNGKIEELNKQKIINSHELMIPLLIKNGAYYLVFKQHLVTLLRHKIPIDISYSEFYTQTKVTPEERKRYLNNWKSNGGRFPTFFKTVANQKVVNTQTIKLGEFLFHPNSIENKAFDEDRIRLNKFIRKNLSGFYRFVLILDIPDYFRQILIDFSNRYNYTVPSED